MTRGALHVSAIAFGVAALALMSPHSTVSADPSATGAATPSLAEPAPTPKLTISSPDTTAPAPGAATSFPEPPPRPRVATSGDMGSGAAQPTHAYGHHYARAYSHRYRDRDPVTAAASGVVGGVADLGAIAAYPVYCFPRYGSCPVYRPYP